MLLKTIYTIFILAVKASTKKYIKAKYEIATEVTTLGALKDLNSKYESVFMIYYTDSSFINSVQGPLNINYEEVDEEDSDLEADADDVEIEIDPAENQPDSELKVFVNSILKPLTDIDVQVAAVDCDESADTRQLCGDQGVMRYPTFKLYDRQAYPLTWMDENLENRMESSQKLPKIEEILHWVNDNIVTGKAGNSKNSVNRFVNNMSGGLLFQMIREKLKLVLFCNRNEDVCMNFQIGTWKLATEKGFGKLNLVKKGKLDFAYVDCGAYDEICDGYQVERDFNAKRTNSNFHKNAHRMHMANEPESQTLDDGVDVEVESTAANATENLTVMLLSFGKEAFRTKIDRPSFRYPELVETIKEVIRNKLDKNYKLLDKQEIPKHDEL